MPRRQSLRQDMKNWTEEEKKEWRRLSREAKLTPEQKKARAIRQDMKNWTAEEKKEWRKLQRKEYYIRNKDKIQQKAKERRAEKNRKQRVAKYPEAVSVPTIDMTRALNAPLGKVGRRTLSDKTTKSRIGKVSPYNQFVKTNYYMVQYDNPSFKPPQIMKKLGEMWSRQKKR